MTTTEDNFQTFYSAEARMNPATPATLTGRGIYKFGGSSTTRIPMHIRSGYQSFGQPTERKKFTQVEFHGKGTIWCRVYVDGVYIFETSATMTETPAKDRRVGLPIGLRGYAMDIEISGDADLRAVEYSFSPMQSPS